MLVVRRTSRVDERGALPGGGLARGDRVIERARERELHEETGLRIEAGPTRAAERSGFAVVLLLEAHLLDPLSQFRASAEVCEVAWAEPHEVIRLSPVNARLLRRALA